MFLLSWYKRVGLNNFHKLEYIYIYMYIELGSF